jgi:hypothetical protein
MQVVSFVNSPTTTPPDAKQPGSAVLLDTGDVRLLSAAQVGNSVSAVHTTACSFAGGSGGAESCFTYRRLAVGQSVGGSPTVGVSQTLSAFGYGADSFTFWPSVAVLSNNTALATLQVTDVLADATPVRRLSTLANVKLVGGAWYAGFAVASGTCAQTFSNRTGDYTGSVADPALTSFWSAGERSLVISGTCQWDTRIARILVP